MSNYSKDGILAIAGAAGGAAVSPTATAAVDAVLTKGVSGAKRAMSGVQLALEQEALVTNEGIIIRMPKQKTVIEKMQEPLEARQIQMGKRNASLAGEEHPITGVRYNENAYPEFESKANIRIPKNLKGANVSDRQQFRNATEQLWAKMQKSPKLKEGFTQQQLADIEAGKPKITGLTWHHHEDGVRLQLVDTEIHAKTGHDGGRRNTGGRP